MKRKIPKVDIVVLNYNGIDDSRACLTSLLKTSYPNFRITLVDNGSKNNEYQVLKKEFNNKRLTFLRFRNNKGFTGGNNGAVKRLKSKYVVLLNNDTKVNKDWLIHLVDEMEKDENFAVAQPKIRLMHDSKRFDYAGAAGGFIDKYGYPFAQGRIFNTLEEDVGQYNKVRDIFWASGAAVIIRRKVIPKVGGLFDNTFFNYMEEIDFCWRVWANGYRVIFIPKSLVYHKVAATAKKNLFWKRFWEHRNNLLLLAKNTSGVNFYKIIFLRSFFELATYLYYIATGQFRYIGSLFCAHGDFLRLYFSDQILRINRNSVAISSNPDIPIYQGSIVLDYFLKGKKSFRDLNWWGVSGERTVPGVDYLAPTIAQHLSVYKYCLTYTMRKKVLDIGCGSGNGSYLLAKKARNVLAIDNDRATIAAAKFSFKANNLEFKSTDILDLEEDKKFDVIISLQVIEHIPEPNVYLSKIYKLLKSRGTVILSTPNKLTQSYNENPYHIKEYSEAELVSLLNKYFSKVTILGLFGDKIFNTYEAKRKRKVLRILKLDKLGIRYILPRRIKIFFFNFLIPVVRRKLITSERGKYLNITEKNFHIDRYSKEAIDLIAVCTK